MQNIFVEFLPPWIETGLQPAFYDKESGTVLQQVARMYAKVNWLIRLFNKFNKDTVDEVNKFENDTTEIINDYIARFVALKDFVDDYFDNLDVQEEINNKLDQMVEDGTLQEIIASYLDANAVWGFDTVNDMVNAPNLINGSFARTLGYRAKNDGGAGLYKIRTITNDDVVDGGSIIEMADDSLIAELIVDDKLVPEQFGAYGDGTHDDLQYLNTCRNFCATNHIIMSGLHSSIYAVSDGFDLTTGCSYDFNLATFKALNAMTYVIRCRISRNVGEEVRNEYIKNVIIDCDNKADYGFFQDIFGWSQLIDNIRVLNHSTIGIYIKTGQVRLNNCKIEQMLMNKSTVGLYLESSDNEVSNIVIRNCTTGIRIKGENNSISEAHPVMNTDGLVNGSVGYLLDESVKLVNCSSDCYNYGIKLNTLHGFSCANFKCIISENYQSSDASETPYFIYSPNTDVSYTQRISLFGCTMTTVKIFNDEYIKFSNFVTWAGSAILDNNGDMQLEIFKSSLPKTLVHRGQMTDITSYLNASVSAVTARITDIGDMINLRIHELLLPSINSGSDLNIATNLPSSISTTSSVYIPVITKNGVTGNVLFAPNGTIRFYPSSAVTSNDYLDIFVNIPKYY